METCCDYIVGEKMFVSSDEPKVRNKLLRLKDQYPDDVHIIADPEINDGTIYCTVPAGWLKISPPKKREMTEEQKKILAERMKRQEK